MPINRRSCVCLGGEPTGGARLNDNPSNVQTHHETIFVEKKTFSVALCSAFRDSVPYFYRYMNQVGDLWKKLSDRGDSFHCVWGEGDSVDGTLRLLNLTRDVCRWKSTIVDCTHGGGDYGSVVRAERFKQLAHVGNTIWAAIPAETDIVVYVESDLIWQAETIMRLIDHVATGGLDAVVPKIILRRTGWPAHTFYDIWAYRYRGQHFSHHRPYFQGYKADQLTRIDSAGSCMAICGELARKVNFPDDDVFVGLSRQIYEQGCSLWFDPTLAVTHH